MRLLLLLLVALAHGRRALAPVGRPAPHVARGLPGPAVGLAPVVRDRLVDTLAAVGGDGVGAGDGLRQRRGRGTGQSRPVVGGLEVLGAAMLVASLGHAHRRGALFARAGEARGRVREQSANALLAEAAAARLPLALRRALRLLVAVADDTHGGELGVVNADQRIGCVVVRGALDLFGPGQVVVEQRGFADAAVRATGRNHCRGAIIHPPHGALQLQPHACRGLLRRRQALVLCGVALPSGALGLVGEGPAEGGGGRIRFRLASLRRGRRWGRRRTSIMLGGFAQVLERPRPFHPAHPAVEERPVALGGAPENALELLGNILIVRRDVGSFGLVSRLVDAKQGVNLSHELVETARVAHQVCVREHVLCPRHDLLVDAFGAGKRVPLRVGPLLDMPLEQVPSLLIGALLEEAVGPRFVRHAVLIEDQGRRHAFDRRPQHSDHAQLATLGLEGTSHVSEHVVHHVLQPGGAVVCLKDDLWFLRGEHLLRPLPARRVLPSVGVGHPFILLCWPIVSPVQTIVAPPDLLQAVKDGRAARLRYVHIVEQPAGHGLDIPFLLLQPTPALGACAGKVTRCRHGKRRGHPPHMACRGETAGGSKLGASSVPTLRSGRRHGRCGRKGQHGAAQHRPK